MDQKLVREKECADAVSVSVRTLRYWRRRRIIPFLKVGTLVIYDLDEVLQALKTYKRESINLRPVVVPSHSRKKPEKIATAKLAEAK
jgi:hypothetical protein